MIQESTGLASRDGPSIPVKGACCGIGTPRPTKACTNGLAGRSPGWQVVDRAGLPGGRRSRLNQWRKNRGADSLHTVAGAATVVCVPSSAPKGTGDTVLCLFSNSTTTRRP